MALNIYDSADPGSALSDDSSFDNPLRNTIDGSVGGSIEKKLYVRNDDISKTYANIQVTAVDGGDNIVSGATGFSHKLYAGNSRPLEEQWSLVAGGNTIDLGSISDTNTFLPFWLRIDVPRGAAVESYQTVQLQTVADES